MDKKYRLPHRPNKSEGDKVIAGRRRKLEEDYRSRLRQRRELVKWIYTFICIGSIIAIAYIALRSVG